MMNSALFEDERREVQLTNWKEPMLASTVKDHQYEDLKWPYFVSMKVDGIRAVRHAKALLSRANKLIPNLYVQKVIEEITNSIECDRKGVNLLHGLDGELIVGAINAPNVYNVTQSGIMSVQGEPDFTWNVFDRYDTWEGGTDIRPRGRYFKGQIYADRWEQVKELVKRVGHPRLRLIDHQLYSIPGSFEGLVQHALDNGYEGLMLNNPTALYHCGRPTWRMNILHKVKPLEDFEAVIVNIFEQMENTNEVYENERGRSQRSSHQDGLVGKGTLGGFVMRCEDGTEFNCGNGPGLTAALRQYIWDNPKSYIGQTAKCRKQKVGEKDKPRQPRYLGLRSEIDLSPK